MRAAPNIRSRLGRAKKRLAGSATRVSPDVRAWATRAFEDFVARDGDHEGFVSAMAERGARLDAMHQEWLAQHSDGSELAAELLAATTAADDGNIWHSELKFRSYVDVSLQAKVLRVFVDRLASPGLVEMVLRHAPDCRPALLVHGDLLLEAHEADKAVEVAHHLLRIQAVCMTSQELL